MRTKGGVHAGTACDDSINDLSLKGARSMTRQAIVVDEVLKKMASEAVKQGGNLRATVRDLTIKALQTRELSLGQIRRVLHSVTEGINSGAAKAKIDVEKPFADAFAGMDDALLKAVQASQIALQQLTEHDVDFEDSKIKKALNDLEKLEDEFLKSVKRATETASEQVQAQWAGVLQHTPSGATETGERVQALMQRFNDPARTAMRQQREAGMKATHMLTQNFGTLASGVLIGLSEGLHGRKAAPRRRKTRKTRKT
jgi:hypothetical protein